jgi:hypothetical protein
MSEFNGVIVHSDKTSARVDYLVHWLFADCTEWRYALKGENFVDAINVLNYSHQHIPGAVNISPTEWMFEEQLRMPKYRWQGEDEAKLILDDNEHFDAIAAIFFLISRVEEYFPAWVDLHGRYPSSAATNQKFLLVPLADVWRQEIHRSLGLEQIAQKKKVHFSFDIDSAFAYKNKGFARTVGAIGRDFISFKLTQLAERLLCIIGILRDPYDTYDRIINDSRSKDIDLTWFFLLSNRTFENNNIHHTSKGYRKLIKMLAQEFNIGIHPGYDTWKDVKLLNEEVSRLSAIISKPVIHSRQHYLRFAIPETYRKLVENGIGHEYSMGYADTPGFRAGTSMPFAWFDLTNNKVTELIIHPFCAMDVTFSRYQKVSLNETLSMLKELRTQIQETNGIFHMLWHNETLSERGSWLGWSKLWDQILYSLAPEDVH